MKALEIFKSHQGEGKYTGTLMTFVRFKVCKRPFTYELCPMCDTMSKMDNCIEMNFEPKDLSKLLKDSHYNICFTGGEPTLSAYLKYIKDIILHYKTEILENPHACIHFETNGWRLDDLNKLLLELDLPKDKYFIAYSPKFFNEGEYNDCMKYLQDNKNIFNERYIIKLVTGKETIELVTKYLKEIPEDLLPMIYLMPEGVTEESIGRSMKYVGFLTKQFNVHISDRLHVIHSFM